VLVDGFGRPLTNLRISLTSECNYSCIFCHREGEGSAPDALSAEDVELVASAAYFHGVRAFKLTGGEPLLRPDIVEVVSRLKGVGRGVEVSMTTNGFFLHEQVGRLVEAGLDRVNVSLHGVGPEVYTRMTGMPGSERVLRGLRAAKDNGLPVKLNFVLTALNAGELPRLLDFASSMELDINLIELIPTGRGREVFSSLYLPVEKVLPVLHARAARVERRSLHNRPIFLMPEGVRVEVIANYCNPLFCMGCTRIRLTHDAKLKPCLNRNDDLVDVSAVLRDPALSREEKVERLEEAIRVANSKREPFFKLVNGYCATADGRVLGKPRSI